VSTQQAQNRAGMEGGGAGASGEPTEAELRAAYEAELSRITSADMVLQATVSLLNIGARRLGLMGGPDPGAAAQGGGERDLEQVRDAIDAVRGLMPIVERRAPQEARPLRDALSQLQMAYAREAPPAPEQTGAQGAPSAAQGAPTSPQGAPTSPEGAPTSPQGTPGAPNAAPQQPQPGAKPGPGPAESSGRLWVPGR